MRYVRNAKNPWKFTQMVKIMRMAQDEDDLKNISITFIVDLSFERADICLALKCVETERGWKI